MCHVQEKLACARLQWERDRAARELYVVVGVVFGRCCSAAAAAVLVFGAEVGRALFVFCVRVFFSFFFFWRPPRCAYVIIVQRTLCFHTTLRPKRRRRNVRVARRW